MIRPSWKCLLLCAVVVTTLLSTTHQASAQWWGVYRPVSYGWGCGYGSCYSPCYSTVGCRSCYGDSGWYAGWRPGPVRRLVFGPYRWYWGGYCGSCYTGSCYTGGCYSGCDNGGCNTGCATCGNGMPTATPANKPPQAPTPAQKPVEPSALPTEQAPPAPAPSEPAPPKTTSTDAETSGILTVWVPYDAKVTVNGLETRSSGSRRQFVSNGLKPGLSYKYVVRAQVVRDGQLVEDTRTVTLTAGQITAVAFGFNTEASQQVAMTH
jgi:uncharacterized protein (TIGR03000 family)